MKITKNRIKMQLIAKHGWDIRNLESDANRYLVNQLIGDTVTIIDNILKAQKGITIKG